MTLFQFLCPAFLPVVCVMCVCFIIANNCNPVVDWFFVKCIRKSQHECRAILGYARVCACLHVYDIGGVHIEGLSCR